MAKRINMKKIVLDYPDFNSDSNPTKIMGLGKGLWLSENKATNPKLLLAFTSLLGPSMWSLNLESKEDTNLKKKNFRLNQGKAWERDFLTLKQKRTFFFISNNSIIPRTIPNPEWKLI